MKTSSLLIYLILFITLAIINESYGWPFGDSDEKIDQLNRKVSFIESFLRKITSAVRQNSDDIEALKTGGLVTNHRAQILERLQEMEQQLDKGLE